MSSSHSALQRLGNRFTLFLVIVAVSLVILEFVIHRHGEIALEDLPLFPAVYAFFVCILIVVGGIWLRKIAMRPEDYYDDE
jgi:protein-S-isoprenylcysteine O-methyltransferase Ste14